MVTAATKLKDACSLEEKLWPTYGKFLNWWEYQTTLPISWETCMQDKKQQLEPDIEQQTGSKSGKEYVNAVSVTLLI